MDETLIYQCSPDSNACLCQGEILSGLFRFCVDASTIASPEDARGETEPAVVKIDYQYVVVLSQLCDLENDNKSRQAGNPQLPDVIFCQVPTAEELRKSCGGSDIWKRIKQNKDERYHFLERVPSDCDACNEGVPELGVDFKRYFTLPTDEIYQRLRLRAVRRRSVLHSPYVEHLSSRFAYFLSRVALPRDHISE